MGFSLTGGYTFLAGEDPTSFKLNKLVGGGSIPDGGSYTFAASGFAIQSTGASGFSLAIKDAETLTANRVLSLNTGNADRTITISGNPTLNDWFDQSVKTTASPQFANLALGIATPLARIHAVGNGNYGTGVRLTNGGTHRWEFLHDGAEGLTFGYDGTDVFFINRSGTTQLNSGNFSVLAGLVIVDGATSKTIKYTNGTANGAVATTMGGVGPTGSTAGNPQGWLRVNVAGTDRYVPFW